MMATKRESAPRGLRVASRSAVVIGTLLALQCGCTTKLRDWANNGLKVGPEYQKPPAPVADDWINLNSPSVDGGRIAEWWTVFQDPVLADLIQTAYAQNLTLRAAGTRVLQARAQQAIAVGAILPQSQQAFGQYSRVNASPNQPNNPTSLMGALPPGVESPFENHYSDWQAGFDLSWELDVWGRFRRQIESANANLDAQVEDYDAVLVTLLADVAENYTRYRVAQQRIKIATENVRIQEQTLSLADEKFRVGTSTKLDVNQAETVVSQTRSTIPALEIELGRANDALCTLLGMPPQDLAPLLGAAPDVRSGPLPVTPDWVAAGLPADLLRQRPDVRGAEREIAAQSARIGVAEADLYPSFFINGKIGYESQDLASLFESQSFMGTIVPNFRWNILNYGRVFNNVRLQEARTLELIAEYQATVLTAGREVQTSLRGFVKSQQQAADLARSVVAASSASEVGRDQYRTGTVPFNTVFNLETTQVQQQDQLAVVQGAIALNLIEVYRSLGGGWELRLDQPACPAAPGPIAATPEGPADFANAEVIPLPMPSVGPEEPNAAASLPE